MEQEKDTSPEDVFLDNNQTEEVKPLSTSLSYTRFLFEPKEAGSGHRRNPSYDSRDSTKSVSECSFVSGSPCESPGLHELGIRSLSSSSSTPQSSSGMLSENPKNPFHSEKDFVDFLLTLPPPSPATAAQPLPTPPPLPPPQPLSTPPHVGLDHLENLCKLMEQLGELKEHNHKLQQRVQYLEEIRNLREIKGNLKQVLEEGFARSQSPRQITARNTHSSRSVKLRPSPGRRQNKQQKGRSQSMGEDEILFRTFEKAKVSKWAKVKEALKWERVQADDTMVSKATLTLKPTIIQEPPEQRAIISQQVESSTTSSSNEDEDEHFLDFTELNKRSSVGSNLVEEEYKKSKEPDDKTVVKMRKGRSLERNLEAEKMATSVEKDGKKMSKGAWGKVKTILQTRKDSLKRKQRKSACLEMQSDSGQDSRKTKHSASSPNCPAIIDVGGDDDTEPTAEKITKSKSPKKLPQLNIETDAQLVEEPVKINKVKKSKDEEQGSKSVPASPLKFNTFQFDQILQDLKEFGVETELEKERSRVTEEGAPLVITSDVLKNLEEIQRNVTHEFNKKMQEWQKIKSPKHNPNYLHTSPQLERKSSSFSGHKMKKSKVEAQVKGKAIETSGNKGEKHREKELQWLEKQLQKIEREKQRLAKERQKYLQRELRLEKMKETMMKPLSEHKKEVLVKTSAGEFRFEGISEKFTRKLHEWETMRGIGPEISTLTLLGHQKPTTASKEDCNSLAPPPVYRGANPRLRERNRSRSESSLANVSNVQTSTTSLLLMVEDKDIEHELNTDSSSFNVMANYSRANSDPEICVEGGPCAIEVEQMHFEEPLPSLEIPSYTLEKAVYSYAPVEVTRLIDSSSNSGSDMEIKIVDQQQCPEKSCTLTDNSQRKLQKQEAILSCDGGNHQKNLCKKKVKEMSAQLLQQAKTIEQTLMEKNVTIRQLQWQLLQKEMSTQRLHSQLEKVTNEEFELKSKSSHHQRSWSAAEATQQQQSGKSTHSPLELLKITEKLDMPSSSTISATPIGLAQKVDELKSELSHLWGSQESNDQSLNYEVEKQQWTTKQNESLKESREENVKLNEIKMTSLDNWPSPKLVATRRVSDTVLSPATVACVGRVSSKLPVSPLMKSRSLSQNNTPTPCRKVVQTVSQMAAETSTSDLKPKTSVQPQQVNNDRITQHKGVKLSRQKRMESNKEKCHFALRRQNAEDFVSSSSDSNSDEESSSTADVTFTLNLEKLKSKVCPAEQKNNLASSRNLNTSAITVPWRKNSRDDTSNDERQSAPSTPVVRSRSTRKLKPPSACKELVPSSPTTCQKFKENTTQNVRLMIEKFNKNEVSSSPTMSRQFREVKKSTSFSDAESSKFGFCSPVHSSFNTSNVVKSASAGIICSKPPLSPEVTPRRFLNSQQTQQQQPIGVASRIPRCLTAISEQENRDLIMPTSSQNPKKIIESNSPTIGIRALEIKRAKESFLNKNVESPILMQSNWKPIIYQPQPPATAKLMNEQLHRSSSNNPASPKPKSILKHNVIEVDYVPEQDQISHTSDDVVVRRQLEETEDDDDEIPSQIIKSASAGAVDFAIKYGKCEKATRLSSQVSTDSSEKYQKGTCGLFSFRFRRPRLKHKKASPVEALCRQSLIVDIQQTQDENPHSLTTQNLNKSSKSCPPSPETNPKWQSRSKSLFKSK